MKLATIGSGIIVEQFLDACRKVENVELVAVYSRNYETGKKLADKFEISKVYTDLDDLCDSPDIDTVYVASPNSLHYEQTKLILNKGKNAIVEKPFTSHDRESAELIELAKQKNVYLFEAMSILYLPNLQLLKEKLALIEPIKWVEASMCQYSSKFNAFKAGELPNIFNPAFSGGALMDLNIYHLNFIVELFGFPELSQYLPNKHANGIDLSGILILKYPNLMVSAIATKDSAGRPYGVLHGEKGMIECSEGINGLRSFTLTQGKEKETFNVNEYDNRLVYEVKAFEEMMNNQDQARMLKQLEFTQNMMVMLTDLRKKSGIKFAADEG